MNRVLSNSRSENLLAQTSFLLAPKIFWWAELISQFFCKFNSSKYFTCPSGKLRTEFTSPIAKSTSLGHQTLLSFHATLGMYLLYMFLLQLQLYVLTIIRVTLRRIHAETFRRKSTCCKFKYTILSKGYKESHFYKLTVIVVNELYTDQLYWQKSTWLLFTSVYFWYHSILRGSIDQKHAKTNEIWRQNSEIHPAFACSRWPPWFPDLSRTNGACV